MQTPQRTRTARLLLPLALVALLGAAACSGADEGAADDDVATLGVGDDASDDATGEDDGSDGGGRGGGDVDDAEFQDAILEFAECMREHGIDFPDPQVQEGGGVVVAGPAIGGGDGPPSDAEIAEMEAADEACRPIMEEVEGAMDPPDPEQIQEMQDQALEFAQCMREHGIDVPDPVFGEGGRMTQTIGEPGGGGVDPSDEDFQEAAEACGSDSGFGISVGSAGPAGPDGEDG